MRLNLAPSFKNLRALTTLARLDANTAPAEIRIYGGPEMPPGGAPAANNPLIAVFTLAQPAGTVTDGTLTLSATGTAQVIADGAPTQARFVDGAGDWVMDADAGVTNAVVIISAEFVYTGSFLALVSAAFTEPG